MVTNAVRCFILFSVILLLSLYVLPAQAITVPSSAKVIIVLDDVGYRQTDIDAFALPVEVAFSILPHTPHGKLYAEMANQQGRDVMLHLPMASMHKKNLGPSALTVGMYSQDIEQTLTDALSSVPYVVGVNNHMGSMLTAQPQAMSDLMMALKKRALFFIDSRTTPHSVAYETAKSVGLPTDKRHIFLDHEQTEEFYNKQLARLIRIAKKHGRAIGIAHPYPSSMEFLAKALAEIEQQGVELVPVSQFFSNMDDSLQKRFVSPAQVAPSD